MRGKQIIKIDGRNYALETTFSGEVGIYRSRRIETTGHISSPAEENTTCLLDIMSKRKWS